MEPIVSDSGDKNGEREERKIGISGRDVVGRIECESQQQGNCNRDLEREKMPKS